MGLGANISRENINNGLSLFKDILDDSYYGFVDEEMLDNPSAIYSEWYYGFLKPYFCRNIGFHEEKHNRLSNLERAQLSADSCFSGANRMLSGKQKDYFKQYTFSDLVRFYSDTLTIDSLAQVYDIPDYQLLLSVMGTNTDKKRIGKMGLTNGDTIPLLLLVNEADELINFKKYNTQGIYVNIWATWCVPCVKNIPILNELIS